MGNSEADRATFPNTFRSTRRIDPQKRNKKCPPPKTMNRALLALALGADVVSGHGMMTKPASRQIVHHTAIDPKVAGSDGYSTVIHNPAQTDLVSLNAAIGGGGKAKAAAEGHGLCGAFPRRPLRIPGSRSTLRGRVFRILFTNT